MSTGRSSPTPASSSAGSRSPGCALRTGYVEAVATSPARQGEGFGTLVMEDVGEIIRAGFELGGLGTGAQHFYERLGWRVWPGPTLVRAPGGDRATPDDDGFVMVLRTPSTPPLDEARPDLLRLAARRRLVALRCGACGSTSASTWKGSPASATPGRRAGRTPSTRPPPT